MSKIFKLKLFLLLTYFYVALIYFYEEHFVTYEGTLFTYDTLFIVIVSMSLGVIVSAIIYNFSLYFYVKEKQYLFYALAQTSGLFFLINLDSLFIAPFDTLFQLQSFFLFDLSQILMLFFSILFLKSFFEAYKIKNIEIIAKVISYLCLLDFLFLLIFSHIIVFKFMPIFLPILVLLTEAIEHVEKKDVAFRFIIVGWSIVVVTVFLGYFGILALLDESFPFFHIAIAMESIFLSLALAYKVKLIHEEKEKQQLILLQQSRLASMGEMISSIAHQWRQPLNLLSFGLMNIKEYSAKEERSLKIIELLNQQLQYMSSTIEDFRNFYNPSKVKNDFDIYKTIKKASGIAFSSLENSPIDISIKVKENFTLYGYQNELEQVILSLINNAKDAFISREIENPALKIVVKKSSITITDNAGGIDKENIKKIFDSYFSTKKDGDGIGLYISKLIIENEFNGKIEVESQGSSTSFTIKFDK